MENNMGQQTVRILVADDHDLIRQGFVQVLREVEPRCEVSEARTWGETLLLAESVSDLSLAIVDLNMPDRVGMDGVRALLRQTQTLPVAVLSACEDPQAISAAIHAGASGFIPKSASVPVMRSALQLLLAGEMYLPSAMLVSGGGMPVRLPAQEESQLVQLTPRQHQVVQLLIQGCSNKTIATELGMADATVKAHLNAIYRILGVGSRVEAICRLESM